MNILIMGPYGSGKGTQSKIISRIYGLTHVSTGDLLDSIDLDLEKKYQNELDIMRRERVLFPDGPMVEVLERRISKPDCESGFILDGFPRTFAQADFLDSSSIVFDYVIGLNISDEEAIFRMANRWSCDSCGEIYNALTEPIPRIDGYCNCGSELVQKSKDTSEEGSRKRLMIYHEKTEPLLERYNAIMVNGSRNISEVTSNLVDIL